MIRRTPLLTPRKSTARPATRALRGLVAATSLLATAGVSTPALSFPVLSSPVLAQTAPDTREVNAARDAYNRGLGELRAKNYEKALELFEQADITMAVPSTRARVADALAGLGRLVEAREKAKSVSAIAVAPDENEVQAAARQRATALVQKLASRVAILTFDVPAGPNAMVSVDAVTVPRGQYGGYAVDPGAHQVKVYSDGGGDQQVSINVAEGEQKAVSFDGSDSGSSSISPLVWIGVGLAGAGLVTGVVAGAITLGRSADVAELCTAGDGDDCLPDQYGLRDDALTSAHVSTAGFAVAGVGAVVAVIGLLVGSDDGSDADVALLDTSVGDVTLTPLVGPNFVGVRGTF